MMDDFDERFFGFQERIRNEVKNFRKKLKSFERDLLEEDDLFNEAYIILREKDDKYNPVKGDYFGYARSVMRNHFIALRDQSHTVVSPRDSSYIVDKYKNKKGGKVNRKKSTIDDIVRSLSSNVKIDEELLIDHNEVSPLDVIVRGEDIDKIREFENSLLEKLPIKQILVITKRFGLRGNKPKQIWEIAFELGVTVHDVRDTLDDAIRRLKVLSRKALGGLHDSGQDG